MTLDQTVKPAGIGGRQRKAHTKSRKGCRNCKLRGVKCDETKPGCKRCAAYGAACNYNSKAPDLEIVLNGASTIIRSTQSGFQNFIVASTESSYIPPIHPLIYPAIHSRDSKHCIELNSEEISRLGRFQMRTVLLVGSRKAGKHFQNVVVDLACANPCLMHVIQAITSIHDRYLSGPRTSANSALTISERKHLWQAAKLFNEELSNPIEPSRRDGLWAIAALLGATSWATIEASKPEEAWPLTSPDSSDLMWIKMSENKAAIWEIAQPLRSDSIWYALASDYQRGISNHKPPIPGIEDIPPDFVKLYELTEASTPDNNPYHAAVRSLTSLLPHECTREELGPFVAFIAHFKPEFRQLLEERDPRAMLLIAYWYMKVGNTVWSLDWRSKLECQAICIYLEKYCWLHRDLMCMIQTPKKWCGAASPHEGTLWFVAAGLRAQAGGANAA